MILVTRINKIDQFYINENLIEFIEEMPDTLVTLESGKKIVVMESAEELIERIIEQKQRVMRYRDFQN